MPELQEEIKTQLDVIRSAAMQRIDNLESAWKKHFEELKAAGAPVDEVKDKLERALKRIDLMEQELTRQLGSLGEQWATGKSVGQQLIESAEYKDWATRVGKSQKSSFRHKINTLWGYDDYSIKTTITSATVGSSTPGILVPQRVPGIVKPGVRALRVRDLIPRFPTTNNAVEWVKENVFTNAASPVAETISKGESALTFTIDSSTVKTIAHWIPAAKQVLDDFAQLQAYVEMRLLEGLKDIEDNEIVTGSGTGQHLSGFSTEATAYDTARNVASDTKIDKLNHAISQIEDALQVADGIILHPQDWRAIQLIKTEEGGANKGSYILGGPQMVAAPNIWGLPVATTTAVTVGTFYVGSFQRYTALFDRMDATVDVSTEHSDFFVRNLIAIRAEERIALAVYRSDALVYGSF